MDNSNQITLPCLAIFKGMISIPGDKSISHRAAIFASLAQGQTTLSNYLTAEDTIHTLEAFKAFGVEFTIKDQEISIQSPGLLKLVQNKSDFFSRQNEIKINLGNSGTAMRVLAGFFSGIPGAQVTLVGDESLHKRPMLRVIDPLTTVGAKIESDQGRAPLKITGHQLNDIKHISKVSSAQVKTSLCLAALMSGVKLDFDEPEISRDHTENFLVSRSQLKRQGTHLSMAPPYCCEPFSLAIPGDISAAAFFIVAALCAAEGSAVELKNVGLNPTRIGIIEAIGEQYFEYKNVQTNQGEKSADIIIRSGHGKLKGRLIIKGDIIPRLIDEIPILSILGLFYEDGFEVDDAAELRVKESDRIRLVVDNLRRIGIEVEEWDAGYRFGSIWQNLQKSISEKEEAPPSQEVSLFERTLTVIKEKMKGQVIETAMDHRIVMSFAVLDRLLQLGLDIKGKEWSHTSFPSFFTNLDSLLVSYDYSH